MYFSCGIKSCLQGASVAPSEDLVREHARQTGFPANEIMEVKAIIDPTTAEARGS